MSVTNQITDITWRYIDRQGATIKALRDYATMETIIDNTPDDLKAIEADLPGLSSPVMDGSRRAFNPTAAEDKILGHLERIDNRTRKYLQAKDYMAWFNPAWQALTDEERDVLEVCFLSGYESATDAICEVQDRLHVERSTAYNRRKTALDHLTSLLYGR
ncbi:MAG: hypothetical protein PUK59_02750 [Actinomycetaceae bacterium]|nr:hypothetical protein [Actinomycetaceae bacterium]MDY5273973.1 hypothetical protein [Arcanobacterium sp.]